MSHLPPYDDPMGSTVTDAVVEKRTSGLAITALVLTIVLGWVPCCGAIAPLLGIIALIVVIASERMKGIPLAIIAIVIGVGAQAGWIIGLQTVAQGWTRSGENLFSAMEAGDWDAVRAVSSSDIDDLSDMQLAAFAAEFATRYGALGAPVGAGAQPQAGQFPTDLAGRPVMPIPLEYSTQSGSPVTVVLELQMFDDSGNFIWRAWEWEISGVEVLDPASGDMSLPPAGAASPAPAGFPAAPADAAAPNASVPFPAPESNEG